MIKILHFIIILLFCQLGFSQNWVHDDKGNAVRESELIAYLNLPLRSDTFPARIQTLITGGEAFLVSMLGKENVQKHIRIKRLRLKEFNHFLAEYGFFRYCSQPMFDYQIIYDNHCLGNIMMQLDSMGNCVSVDRDMLMAYKELFEGNMKVTYDQAVNAVFGSDTIRQSYSITIKNRPILPDKWLPNRTPPTIYWEISEKSCQTCKRGQIDAMNLENQKVGTFEKSRVFYKQPSRMGKYNK